MQYYVKIAVLFLLMTCCSVNIYSQKSGNDKLRDILIGKIINRNHTAANNGDEATVMSKNAAGFSSYLKNSGDIKVNDDNDLYGTDQYAPVVALSKTGVTLVIWTDLRNGKRDLYGQLYASNNAPISGNIKINNNNNGLFGGGYSADSDGKGNYIITWITSSYYVAVQKIDENGNLIGANWRISGTERYCRYSAVKSGKDGTYAISWHVFPKYYVQFFNSADKPLTSDILIEENTKYSYSNSIAADSAGNFGFVYSAEKDGKQSVYFKYYSTQGFQIGNEIKITSGSIPGISVMPLITGAPKGNFLVSWQQPLSNSDSLPAFYSQIVNPFSGLINDNFKPFGDFRLLWFYPLATYDNENFYVFSLYGNDLKAAKIPADGGDISAITLKNHLANYHNGEGWGVVHNNVNSSFIFSWNYQITGRQNVYIQKMDKDYNIINPEISVPNDNGASWQTYPVTGVMSNGNYIVAWVDQREGPYTIYGQLFSSNNKPIGKNFKLVSKIEYLDDLPYKPFDLAVGKNDMIYILYKAIDANACTTGDYTHKFTLQAFNSDGTSTGLIAVRPNNKNNNIWVHYSDFKIITTDKNDIGYIIVGEKDNGYCITIVSYINGIVNYPAENVYDIYTANSSEGKEVYTYSVNNSFDLLTIFKPYRISGDTAYLNGAYFYGQIMRRNGEIGDRFLLDTITPDHSFYPISTYDNENNFLICWQGYDGVYYDTKMFFQKITPYSSVSKSDLFPYGQYNMYGIYKDYNDNFVLLSKKSNDFYMSRISKDMSLVADPQLIMSDFAGNNLSFCYSGGKILWTWNDALTEGTGMDIYLGTNSTFENYIPKSSVNSILFNNFPNPFNASTNISYSIPYAGHVNLSVYNTLGQEVARLVDQYQVEGSYKTIFNAGKLSSGIYFIQLNTPYSSKSGKIILVK